jgi:hypothetical protein
LLYQIKVNYKGTKYLGMTIVIDRKARHVTLTLTMPGYIDKLLRKENRPKDGGKMAFPKPCSKLSLVRIHNILYLYRT